MARYRPLCRILHTALAGLGLFWLPIAVVQADIMVVVHPDNPLMSLSEENIRRIFLGRMRMFPNSSQGIETVDQNEQQEVFIDFYHAIAHLTPAKLKRQRASYLFSGKGRLPHVLDSDDAVIKYVAKTPEAIGYISQEKVDSFVKVVGTIKP